MGIDGKPVSFDFKNIAVEKQKELTNVGILVFEEENFSNPTRLIPLGKLEVAPVAQRTAGKPYAFNLTIDKDENIMLRAPDRDQFGNWIKSLRGLINEVKKKPSNFKLN